MTNPAATNHLKLILCLLVTLAVGGALGWAGVLGVVWDSDKVHIIPVGFAVNAYALYLAWRGRWIHGVDWIANIFPVIGMVWVIYAILLGFHNANFTDQTQASQTSMEVGQALVGTLIGFGSLGWLRWLRWVCERRIVEG
jgi:hypothetical protein